MPPPASARLSQHMLLSDCREANRIERWCQEDGFRLSASVFWRI
jgi:hypothetical protein